MKTTKEIEYIPDITDIFRSSTLRNVLSELDYRCWSMEETIRSQKEEIKDLNQQVSKHIDEQLSASYRTMGNTLSVMLGIGKITTPESSVMLMRIEGMQTLEEVKEYIQQLKENTKTTYNEKQNSKSTG